MAGHVGVTLRHGNSAVTQHVRFRTRYQHADPAFGKLPSISAAPHATRDAQPARLFRELGIRFDPRHMRVRRLGSSGESLGSPGLAAAARLADTRGVVGQEGMVTVSRIRHRTGNHGGISDNRRRRIDALHGHVLVAYLGT